MTDDNNGGSNSVDLAPGIIFLGRAINIFKLNFYNQTDWEDSYLNKKHFLFDDSKFTTKTNPVPFKWNQGTQNPKEVSYLTYDQVDLTPQLGSEFTEVTQETLSEFFVSLSFNIGMQADYKRVFSGFVDFSFDRTQITTDQYWYYWAFVKYTLYTATLNLSPSERRNFLTKDAKNDIATMDPQKLFDKYGTHYVNDLICGASMSYLCTVEKKNGLEKQQIQLNGQFNAAKGLVQVGGSADTNIDLTGIQSATYSNVGWKVQGEMDLQSTDKLAGISNVAHLKNSAYSNPTPIYASLQGLAPIWELADTDERRYEIESGFDDYAQMNDFINVVSSEVAGVGFSAVRKGGVRPTFQVSDIILPPGIHNEIAMFTGFMPTHQSADQVYPNYAWTVFVDQNAIDWARTGIKVWWFPSKRDNQLRKHVLVGGYSKGEEYEIDGWGSVQKENPKLNCYEFQVGKFIASKQFNSASRKKDLPSTFATNTIYFIFEEFLDEDEPKQDHYLLHGGVAKNSSHTPSKPSWGADHIGQQYEIGYANDGDSYSVNSLYICVMPVHV